MQKKKTVLEWLSIRYVLNFRAEENFELKWSLKLSHASIILIIVSFLIIISYANFSIFSWYNKNNTELAKQEKRIKTKIKELQLEIDSLEIEIKRRDLLIQDFKNLIP